MPLRSHRLENQKMSLNNEKRRKVYFIIIEVLHDDVISRINKFAFRENVFEYYRVVSV